LERGIHMTTVAKKDLKIGERIVREVTPTFEVYYNEGFGVYQTKVEGSSNMIIKGNFSLPLNIKQVYQVTGKVVLRGLDKQIEVEKYKAAKPKGEEGVVTYLQQLKGLKKRAEYIYDAFKDDSIDMLKNNPEEVVKKVKGVGLKKAKEWQETLKNKEEQEKDILYLLEIGLNSRQANALIENYGARIRSQIKNNPYILIDVGANSNFGFLRCDSIAKKIGIDFGAKERIEQGIIHVLKEASNMGHTYLPKEELFKALDETVGIRLTFTQMNKVVRDKLTTIEAHSRTFNVDLDDVTKRVEKINSLVRQSAKERYRYPLFEVETRQFEEALESLTVQGKIGITRDRVGLSYLKEQENNLAYEIYRISQEVEWKKKSDVEGILDEYLHSSGVKLEDKQREAVLRFSKKIGGFYVLNGSAGSGKTFTLKVILHVLDLVHQVNESKVKIQVLAPTGKASKVASKATGIEAKTIHRGLEYAQGIGFQRNERNPLEANVIIVDESSMVDVSLANSLFKAVSSGAKVILVGDTKQLPSVGAGNVLHDIINSNVIEVVTLDVIKRQGADSGIIENANRVIDGKMMETSEDTKDAYIIHELEDSTIREKTIQSIHRLLTYPDFTFEEIQVLVPQRRGSVGVFALNKLIQDSFNKESDKNGIRNIKSPNVKLYFKKGDKVIHTRNKYDKVWHDRINGRYEPQSVTGITNGETGTIVDVIRAKPAPGERAKKHLVVKYDEGYMLYEEGEQIKDLDHAYCLSIHKSQGSQWKAVIMPISTQHAYFLDRNLVYTAWTRSQEFGTVIGPKKTLAMSIKKMKSIKRYTELQNNLIKIFGN